MHIKSKLITTNVRLVAYTAAHSCSNTLTHSIFISHKHTHTPFCSQSFRHTICVCQCCLHNMFDILCLTKLILCHFASPCESHIPVLQNSCVYYYYHHYNHLITTGNSFCKDRCANLDLCWHVHHTALPRQMFLWSAGNNTLHGGDERVVMLLDFSQHVIWINLPCQ